MTPSLYHYDKGHPRKLSCAGPETETGSDACVWAAALAAFGVETAPREAPYARQLGEKVLARKPKNPYSDD